MIQRQEHGNPITVSRRRVDRCASRRRQRIVRPTTRQWNVSIRGEDHHAVVPVELAQEHADEGVRFALKAVLDRRELGEDLGWVHVVFAEYVDAEAFVVIGGLVVDRNHRRLGIGGALMNRAEVWAKERGCSMVRLSSSATRKAAHNFYEDLGYVNIKTQYSFIKPLDPAAAARVRTFVPRVDPAS
jgi:GNAT superfamily N-acetyltransferase